MSPKKQIENVKKLAVQHALINTYKEITGAPGFDLTYIQTVINIAAEENEDSNLLLDVFYDELMERGWVVRTGESFRIDTHAVFLSNDYKRYESERNKERKGKYIKSTILL